MLGHHRPIYGPMQYPHMGFFVAENPNMDISVRIASNLNEWRRASKDLSTLRKISARSHVGYGTLQRAINGEGNLTIKNLVQIAQAFGRPVEDLLGLVYSSDRVIEMPCAGF